MELCYHTLGALDSGTHALPDIHVGLRERERERTEAGIEGEGKEKHSIHRPIIAFIPTHDLFCSTCAIFIPRNAEVVDKVVDGYRLPRPPLASLQVYQLMLDSWHRDPECRPTFAEIVRVSPAAQ